MIYPPSNAVLDVPPFILGRHPLINHGIRVDCVQLSGIHGRRRVSDDETADRALPGLWFEDRFRSGRSGVDIDVVISFGPPYVITNFDGRSCAKYRYEFRPVDKAVTVLLYTLVCGCPLL